MRPDKLSNEPSFRSILDALPAPVLIVDRNLQVFDANHAARELMNASSETLLRRLCGDVMQCIHARQAEGGCGSGDHCPDCILRQTVEAVADGNPSYRRLSRMQIQKLQDVRTAWFLVTGAHFLYEGRNLVILTLEDVTEVILLRKLLPICSHCRKVRDDNAFWQNVETYVEKYMDIQFSHGICPACARKHYPEINDSND